MKGPWSPVLTSKPIISPKPVFSIQGQSDRESRAEDDDIIDDDRRREVDPMGFAGPGGSQRFLEIYHAIFYQMYGWVARFRIECNQLIGRRNIQNPWPSGRLPSKLRPAGILPGVHRAAAPFIQMKYPQGFAGFSINGYHTPTAACGGV